MSPKSDRLTAVSNPIMRLLQAAAVLSLLAFAGIGRADTTNFMGDFGQAFWTAQPQAGAIGFSNANTELVITGPNKPSSETTSVDPITYNGPTSTGLVSDGTVEFDWEYDSLYGLDDSAVFAWTPPGGQSTEIILAQGAGANITGSFSMPLSQGTTFAFVLFTDTPANKIGGSLVVTNFQFQSNVPEPSPACLFAVGTAIFAAARRRIFPRS